MSKGSDTVPETNAVKEWKKNNTQHFGFRLQNSTDADILAYIKEQTAQGKSVQGIIKDALRLAIRNAKTAE